MKVSLFFESDFIGILSRQVLSYNIYNTQTGYCDGYKKYCKRLNAYLQENLAWIRENIEKADPNDVYWQAVGYFENS